jgi:hypothetical protein
MSAREMGEQDLGQGRAYVSCGRGRLQVRKMVVTHASRALRRLELELGAEVRETELARALLRRAELEGSACTQVRAIAGEGRMLRGPAGRWVGCWYSTAAVEP